MAMIAVIVLLVVTVAMVRLPVAVLVWAVVGVVVDKATVAVAQTA